VAQEGFCLCFGLGGRGDGDAALEGLTLKIHAFSYTHEQLDEQSFY